MLPLLCGGWRGTQRRARCSRVNPHTCWQRATRRENRTGERHLNYHNTSTSCQKSTRRPTCPIPLQLPGDGEDGRGEEWWRGEPLRGKVRSRDNRPRTAKHGHEEHPAPAAPPKAEQNKTKLKPTQKNSAKQTRSGSVTKFPLVTFKAENTTKKHRRNEKVREGREA